MYFFVHLFANSSFDHNYKTGIIKWITKNNIHLTLETYFKEAYKFDSLSSYELTTLLIVKINFSIFLIYINIISDRSNFIGFIIGSYYFINYAIKLILIAKSII